MAIASINPATGETLQTYAPLSDREIEEKLAIAQAGFEGYRRTTFEQRTRWMERAAAILEDEAPALGQLITLEMGKPIKSAIAEVKKSAWVCRFYGQQAVSYLADLTIATEASHSFIRYQPLGIILAVMPWNFPFWQVFRFAAPALMAGNVGLLKHASNVPQCALAIAKIFEKAGFPEGAFQTLLIGSDQVQKIIDDDRIKAATLTGSELAGASLAAAAGKQIKKTVLELGGSDPFIVLESADLATAVTTAVKARLQNNGQSCIAAKRFIVIESIFDRFEQQLVAQFEQLTLGNPLEETTDIGPLATAKIRDELHQQVQKLLAQGASLLTGGQSLEGPGNFYTPTILSQMPLSGTMADTEEFFGPVALLFRVANLEEAIALANRTPFGLGASAWTADPAEQQRLIDEIEAGAVFINSMVKSDPRLPFGGIKRSGYGRELGSYGIQEFVNIKTVWVE